MALMEWTDKLSVGISQFDAEHRRLVEMINDLFEAVQTGRSRDVLGDILEELINYTETHFAHEELLLEECEYPDLENHAAEHQILCQQVADIRRKYLSGPSVTLSMEVMNFLKNWLVKHIQGTDHRYSQFLQDRGIR